MPWIVDGNNVMGARPDGWWRDRHAAAVRLVERIDRWQRASGEDVVVVFDGPERDDLTGASRPGLEIRCSGTRARDGADDVVVATVEAGLAAGARPWIVVTSDAGLRRRLPEGVDVGVEGAGTFRGRLDEVDRPPGRS